MQMGTLRLPGLYRVYPFRAILLGRLTVSRLTGPPNLYSGTEGVYGVLGYPTWCGTPANYNSNNYYWVCYGEAPANWTVSFTLNYWCGNTNLVYSTYGSYTYQGTGEAFLTSGIEGDCYAPSVPPRIDTVRNPWAASGNNNPIR
jgi:hypothetical protein